MPAASRGIPDMPAGCRNRQDLPRLGPSCSAAAWGNNSATNAAQRPFSETLIEPRHALHEPAIFDDQELFAPTRVSSVSNSPHRLSSRHDELVQGLQITE